MRYLGENHDQREASFNLAFETGHGRTGRIRVACFNRLAQLVGDYLHQGVRVAVAGVLDQQQGQTADEHERNGFQLIARSLELIATDRRDSTRLTKAGIDNFRFHDLRHTFNTNMRKAGVAPSVIMKMTGHKTAAMYYRYNTVDFGDAQEAYRKPQEFLGQADQPVNSDKLRAGTK